MTKNKSGFEVNYSFSYKGYDDDFYCYDIPFETFMEGVRTYFDNQMVTIDGKDNDIWNALADLDCLNSVFEAMEDWFTEHCKEDAYEEFKEYVDVYYSEEQ